MNYKDLYNILKGNPPRGWRVVHFVSGASGGVYFWPAHIPHLTEDTSVPSDGRLLHFSILFEFHVIQNSGHARILARTRFHGAKPEDDARWLSLRDTAVTHCGGKSVKKSPAISTASVALWDGGDLGKIAYNTPVRTTANLLRSFFGSPPTELSVFINHL